MAGRSQSAHTSNRSLVRNAEPPTDGSAFACIRYIYISGTRKHGPHRTPSFARAEGVRVSSAPKPTRTPSHGFNIRRAGAPSPAAWPHDRTRPGTEPRPYDPSPVTTGTTIGAKIVGFRLGFGR